MTCSSSVASSAPASIDAEIRAAVLRPIMSKYSSTVIGSAAAEVAMSMYCPSHSRTQVSSYRRISRRTLASLNPRSVRRWSATRDRLKMRSPVLIAWGMPWSDHRVARCRRSTSPSSMSSWTRLKL